MIDEQNRSRFGKITVNYGMMRLQTAFRSTM
jgi:hypothetical protein